METEVVQVEPQVEFVPKAAEPSTEDMAAYRYKILLDDFKKEAKQLSDGKVRRVTVALMEYPFENNQPTFSYNQEMKLFNLGLQLMDCKFVLTKAVLDMSEEEIRTVLDETKPEETKETVNE